MKVRAGGEEKPEREEVVEPLEEPTPERRKEERREVKPVPEKLEPQSSWVPSPPPSSAELAVRGATELAETPFKLARRAVRAAGSSSRTSFRTSRMTLPIRRSFP